MSKAVDRQLAYKKKIHEAAMNRAVKVSNVLFIVAIFAVTWFNFYADAQYISFYERGNFVIIFIYALIYFAYGRTYDAFHLKLSSEMESFYSQSLAIIMTDLIMYLVIWMLAHGTPSILPIAGCAFVQVIAALGWCYLAHYWYRHSFSASNVVVVYSKETCKKDLIGEYGYDKRFHVMRKIQIEALLQEIDQENIPELGGGDWLQNVEALFLVDISSHKRNRIIKYCMKKNIIVYVQPRIGDILLSSARSVHMFHLPMMRVAGYEPVPEYICGKRLFDVMSASILLILSSPLFLLTAFAVKFTDGGPAFYRQTRLTQHGRHFDVLKFRSMRVDAEKDGVARLSTGEGDNRITPVGRFIRKCRLDELPQLINIIKGDMSVVGPRPERPEIAEKYEKSLPEFHLRLQGKAGLTGYAQVYGKYNTAPYDKLEMDLMYLARPSFIEDLRIIFATIKILFKADSTEGVENGNRIDSKSSSTAKKMVTK